MLKFTQAQKSLMAIKNMLPRIVTGGVVIQGEPTIYTDPENIPTVMKFMKNHTMTRCKQLIDITAVDVPTHPKRFEVPQIMLSTFFCCCTVRLALYRFELPPVVSNDADRLGAHLRTRSSSV